MTSSAIAHRIFENDELRHALTDPISYEIMKNPVTAADGISYEKETIEAWIHLCQSKGLPITSPMTNAPISDALLPNRNLKNILQELEEKAAAEKRETVGDEKKQRNSPSLSTTPEVEQLSSQVFVELDRVMNLPAIKSLDLKVAQVVALGMESHGKSTLLERLIGLPLFPKDRQRCTICPIRVHLRRTETVQIAEVFIRDLRTKQELHKRSVAMDVLSKSVDELMKVVMAMESASKASGEHEIVINFASPSMPNLDLLDLPGLVASSCVTAPKNLAEQTYALAERVIREERANSIFLLVVDVRAQVNHSRAAELVRVHGIESQTIGAFTKLDCFVSEDDDDTILMQKVCGAELLTTHGWFGCSSRKPTLEPTMDREIDRLATMKQSEKALFERPLYREGVQKNRLGVAALRGRVVALFEDFLCHTWIPNIVTQLKSEMDRLIGEHVSKCGLPIPMQNGVYNEVVAGLMTTMSLCVGCDCNAPALFRIADDQTIRSELNKRLKMLGAAIGDTIDLTANDIPNATKAYISFLSSHTPREISFTTVHELSNKALTLCNDLVDRLCELLSSTSFINDVYDSLLHQDTYSNRVQLDEQQLFNISRFPQLTDAVYGQLSTKLKQLRDLVRDELKGSLREFAFSPGGGFVVTDYTSVVFKKSLTNNVSTSGNQKKQGASRGHSWSAAALNMHNRLIDMWFQALRTHLPTVLVFPVSLWEKMPLEETCDKQRLEILTKLLACGDVYLKLHRMPISRPKLAFSKGLIPCGHSLEAFTTTTSAAVKCFHCHKTNKGQIYYGCNKCSRSSGHRRQYICRQCLNNMLDAARDASDDSASGGDSGSDNDSDVPSQLDSDTSY